MESDVWASEKIGHNVEDDESLSREKHNISLDAKPPFLSQHTALELQTLTQTGTLIYHQKKLKIIWHTGCLLS